MQTIKIIVALTVLFLATDPKSVAQTSHVLFGDSWLSSDRPAQAALVFGYIVGYSNAIHESCNDFTLLLSGREEQLMQKHYKKSIVEVCVSRGKTFSALKPGLGEACCDTYTGIITKFYQRYPAYRGTHPMDILMRLYDGGDKNEEDVYRDAVAHKFRTTQRFP
jgi:hypothetical protein